MLCFWKTWNTQHICHVCSFDFCRDAKAHQKAFSACRIIKVLLVMLALCEEVVSKVLCRHSTRHAENSCLSVSSLLEKILQLISSSFILELLTKSSWQNSEAFIAKLASTLYNDRRKKAYRRCALHLQLQSFFYWNNKNSIYTKQNVCKCKNRFGLVAFADSWKFPAACCNFLQLGIQDFSTHKVAI